MSQNADEVKSKDQPESTTEIIHTEKEVKEAVTELKDGAQELKTFGEGRGKGGPYVQLGNHAMNVVGTVAMQAMEDNNHGHPDVIDMHKRAEEAIIAELENPDISFEEKKYLIEQMNQVVDKAAKVVSDTENRHLSHKRKIFDGVMFGATGGAYGIIYPFVHRGRKKKKKDK